MPFALLTIFLAVVIGFNMSLWWFALGCAVVCAECCYDIARKRFSHAWIEQWDDWEGMIHGGWPVNLYLNGQVASAIHDHMALAFECFAPYEGGTHGPDLEDRAKAGCEHLNKAFELFEKERRLVESKLSYQ